MTETPRKTANEPKDGIDPGGTRPTQKPGAQAAKAAPKVQSGDRNTMQGGKEEHRDD